MSGLVGPDILDKTGGFRRVRVRSFARLFTRFLWSTCGPFLVGATIAATTGLSAAHVYLPGCQQIALQLGTNCSIQMLSFALLSCALRYLASWATQRDS